MKLSHIYNLSDRIKGVKANRGAMTDPAVQRLVTPGTEAVLVRRQQSRQSPGHSEARILQEVCMAGRSGKWGSTLTICVREDGSLWFLLSYLEETGFYYLQKLNQKGSKLWKPGITRIDRRPGTKIRKFPAPFFHPACRIPVVKLIPP